MTKFAEIIEYLCEQGTPSRLPGAWEALPCDPPLFDLPADHAELLRRLQERFALRDLLSARIVQRDSDNRVELSSLLTNNASYLYPLRKPHAKKPFDLMTGAGGTLMGQWPLAAALDDAEISARVEREFGRLFIADSAADVAIHRSLGLPVAPSLEVERLAGERLELFCAKLRLPVVGLRESGPDAAARKSQSKRGQTAKPRIPMSLILVNWRPSQLNLDDVPAMLAACRHLLALEERLGIPLDDFVICKPSVVRLAQLQFALECGTPARVREVLLDGFEDDCVVLDRWPPIERHEPRTLAEAASAGHAAKDQFDRRTAPPDWQLFERILDRDVREPLLQRAAEATDPLERALVVTLAELSREFHAGAWRPADGPVTFRDRVAAAKQILAMIKEVRSWQR